MIGGWECSKVEPVDVSGSDVFSLLGQAHSLPTPMRGSMFFSHVLDMVALKVEGAWFSFWLYIRKN